MAAGLGSSAVTPEQALFCAQLINVLHHWRGQVEQHQGAWDELDAECPEHIARAVEWGLRIPAVREEALRLLVVARGLVLRRGAAAFGDDLLALAASALRPGRPAGGLTAEALAAVELAGQLYQRRGLVAEAERCYRQALRMAEALSCDDLQARMQAELGRFLVEHGRAGEGVPLLKTALAAAERSGARVVMARCLIALGLHYSQVYDGAAALAHLQRALPLVEELGELNYIGRVWVDLGNAHWRMGACAEAQAAFENALAYFQRSGDARLETLARYRMGIVHYERNEFGDAVEHFRYALQRYEQMGEAYELAHVHQSLGAAYWGLREWESAEYHSERALTLGRALGDEVLQAEVVLNLVEICLEQRKRAEGARWAADAHVLLARHAQDPETAGWATRLLEELAALEARLHEPAG